MCKFDDLSQSLVAPLFNPMCTRNGALFHTIFDVSATPIVLLHPHPSQVRVSHMNAKLTP